MRGTTLSSFWISFWVTVVLIFTPVRYFQLTVSRNEVWNEHVLRTVNGFLSLLGIAAGILFT
jgi:hypothetical protein